MDGFDEFSARCHDDMVRALYMAVGHMELGRDAPAEAFPRALQRWERVSALDNPAGWTYRIVHDCASSRTNAASTPDLGCGGAPAGWLRYDL